MLKKIRILMSIHSSHEPASTKQILYNKAINKNFWIWQKVGNDICKNRDSVFDNFCEEKKITPEKWHFCEEEKTKLNK